MRLAKASRLLECAFFSVAMLFSLSWLTVVLNRLDSLESVVVVVVLAESTCSNESLRLVEVKPRRSTRSSSSF